MNKNLPTTNLHLSKIDVSKLDVLEQPIPGQNKSQSYQIVYMKEPNVPTKLTWYTDEMELPYGIQLGYATTDNNGVTDKKDYQRGWTIGLQHPSDVITWNPETKMFEGTVDKKYLDFFTLVRKIDNRIEQLLKVKKIQEHAEYSHLLRHSEKNGNTHLTAKFSGKADDATQTFECWTRLFQKNGDKVIPLDFDTVQKKSNGLRGIIQMELNSFVKLKAGSSTIRNPCKFIQVTKFGMSDKPFIAPKFDEAVVETTAEELEESVAKRPRVDEEEEGEVLE